MISVPRAQVVWSPSSIHKVGRVSLQEKILLIPTISLNNNLKCNKLLTKVLSRDRISLIPHIPRSQISMEARVALKTIEGRSVNINQDTMLLQVVILE